MKKKIAIAVAVVLCLAFALSGCGMVNKKFTPETQTRKITQAVDMAAGLENPTGYRMKKQSSTTALSNGQFYVVEGTLAGGDNAGRRETRIYDYSNGKLVLTVTDTASSIFHVCELDNLGYAIYVYSEPTDDEKIAGSTDGGHVFTHTAAIYSRSGELIAKKETKTNDSSNDIAPSDLGKASGERRKFFRTADNVLWEIDAMGEASRIADNMPAYNEAVNYTHKINGNYYVYNPDSVTVYDPVFNVIGHVEYPMFGDASDRSEAFVLADGKVFYQTLAFVPDTDKNYDVCMVGSDEKLVKLKIRDFIIDPIKGTTKKIACGYVLMYVYNRINAEESLSAYSDDVKNIAFAAKIEDKTINMTEISLYNLGNDGKFGKSLNLVKYQQAPMSTVDGKYFLAHSETGVISVFDAKLKKVTSYPESVFGNLKKHGKYLYDSDKRIIFDYALNKVYEAKKNDKGEFTEKIDILDVGSSDCRIVIYENLGEGDEKFSVFENGEKKSLKVFRSGGDEELALNGTSYYFGRNHGGQFFATYVNSTSKYHYYNFDGTELFASDYRLMGYSVVGGCSVIFNSAHGEYRLLR